MSHAARFECASCRHLLGHVEDGRLRLARSVDVVYVVPGGVAICCPACPEFRIWQGAPVMATSAPGT